MKLTPPCPICNKPSQYDFSSRDLMFNRYERYDYHRCTNCDLIFQHPMPSSEQINAFYPNNFQYHAYIVAKIFNLAGIFLIIHEPYIFQ